MGAYRERRNASQARFECPRPCRVTPLTNAFPKKFGIHAHMVALYAIWYYFARQQKTLRASPAMTAGISDRLWSMDDIVALVDARQGGPEKRGPWKKRS